MAIKIGFVLLTHNKPQQAVQLVNTLDRIFDHPPVAWHHDFSLCDLPLDLVEANAHFVRPHVKTGWGKFSVIDATIAALEVFIRLPNAPDWFVLLSGADYPIKPADMIVQDLTASPFDLHMQHERIIYNQYERHWQRLCYDRYCSFKLRIPSVSKALRPKWRTITINHPALASRFSPFCEKFLCFAGEHWFCARLHVAEHLVHFHRAVPAVANYYQKRDIHTLCRPRKILLSHCPMQYVVQDFTE